MNTAEPFELDSSFLRELQPRNEDVRRLAALATLHRLRPSSELTVEGFLTGLQAHKELWTVVSSLGIVELRKRSWDLMLHLRPSRRAAPASLRTIKQASKPPFTKS